MMKEKVNVFGQELKSGSKVERKRILKEFSDMLDRQVEKMVLFLLIKQGQLALQLSKLADEREAEDTELEGANEAARISRLRDAYHAVGEDLLALLQFVDLNATGLRKILKKFDKRVGYRLSDEYVATRSNHPFSQLQHIFRHVGIGSMVATISRNLAELENKGQPVTSIYEQRSKLGIQDPIIESIKRAEDRLTNSASFLRFLGQQFINEEEELPEEEKREEENYHFVSLVLNLVNTYLYMVNTYIIVPTADKYAMSLGAAPTLCGLIIGSMAVAQLVSSVYLSAWSNKSYYGPLIFSSLILWIGNLLYAVAYNFNSVTILLIGRLLCGLGSARAVNRRYISDCVPQKSRLQASAAFVSASALGMASGPALAGLLEFKYTAFGVTFNANTLPGWIMAVAWFLYLIWVVIGFKEPSHEHLIVDEASSSASQDNQLGKKESQKGTDRHDALEPLLSVSLKPSNFNAERADLKSDSSNDKQSKKPATSFLEASRLLARPLKVQLYVYFMLKFAMEILLSESSVVTQYYFGWGTRSVAFFLALLGLTVLPVNWVVGSYASNIFEDRQLLVGSEILTCVGVIISFDFGILPYSVTQYVTGAFILFVSAEVLEGVNLSLLSKVMSSRLSRGTYNGGLLSTEAGTLARVVADCAITLTGYLGQDVLLNATMFPTLIICIFAVVSTMWTYNSLF
nr:SPX domain-containing membrane protein At4g11810-like isoform X3 [Physcomitrium patens]|eukprot:XP_024377632.1 SPX domain-containing membrane protein At4g11810-like isoform X3 [Physcomitrella patens]